MRAAEGKVNLSGDACAKEELLGDFTGDVLAGLNEMFGTQAQPQAMQHAADTMPQQAALDARSAQHGEEAAAAQSTAQAKTGRLDFGGRDLETLAGEYAAMEGTRGGRLIDVDRIRELSPEYRADRSRAADIHEEASAVSQQLFERALAQPVGNGVESDPMVVFTAGGGGSGKSSAIAQLLGQDNADVTLDGTLSNLDKARNRVQAALDSGRKVEIQYVYRSPENAAASAIERALEPNGRPVPVNELAKAHANSLKTVRALAEEFKNNPNFKVIAIDNNGKMEDVHITDINQIPEVNYVAAKRAFVAAVDAAWAGADAGRVRSDSGEGAQNGQPDAGRDGAVGGVQQHAGAAVRGGAERGNPQQGADAVTGQPRQLTAALYKAFTGREPPARAARGTHASAQNAQAVASRETAFDAPQAGLSGAGATQDALTAAQVAGQNAQNVGQSAPEVGQTPAPAAPMADLSEDARGMVEGGGAATRIITPDGKKLAAQWDVVEADSVQATLKEGVNQPRDRTRAASDAQVRAIAQNPDFDRLSDTSQTMDYGAPTLTREGVIVAGNGRFEGVSGAYAGAPQAAAQYRAQLEENAQRFGLDAQRIRGMKKPVLVRRVTQDADTRQLAVQSNQPAGLRMSDMEQAALDAERMGAHLADLHIHEDGSIAPTQHNHEVIARALGGYTTEEAGEFMAADGGLSQAGLRRVRNAILYRAYGKSDVLTRLLEAPDADMRNVGTALLRAAGSLAENRRAMDENHIPAEYDIAADLESAIAALSRIRASGQHVESFLAQSDWVGGGLSESGRTILRMVSENLRSAKAITQFLREYAARVQSLQNTSGGLFGDMPRPGKQEVLEDVKRRFDEQRNLARGQNDLFGQSADSARGDGGAATADGQDAKPAGVAGDARGAGSGAQAGIDGRGVSGQPQGGQDEGTDGGAVVAENATAEEMWADKSEAARVRTLRFGARLVNEMNGEQMRALARQPWEQIEPRLQRRIYAAMLLGVDPKQRGGLEFTATLDAVSNGRESPEMARAFDAAFWTQGTDASASSGADVKTQSNTEAHNNQGVTGKAGENGGRESNTAKTEEQAAKTEEQPAPSDWVGLTFAQAAEDWDGRGEAQRVKVLAAALRKNEMDLRSRMKTGRQSFAELDPALQRRVAAAMTLLRDKAERNGATVKQLMAQRAGKDLPQTPERNKTGADSRYTKSAEDISPAGEASPRNGAGNVSFENDSRDAETGTSGGVIPGNGQNVEQGAAQGANLNQAEAVRKGNGQNLNQEAGEDAQASEKEVRIWNTVRAIVRRAIGRAAGLRGKQLDALQRTATLESVDAELRDKLLAAWRANPELGKDTMPAAQVPSRVQDDAEAARILQGEPVAQLRVKDALRGKFADIVAAVGKMFARHNYEASRADIGTVELDEQAASDSLGHRAGIYKRAAFAAVPQVVERGALVLHARHGEVNSYYISAPVMMEAESGKNTECIVTVLVHHDDNVQRMYFHSITTKENLLQRGELGASEASNATKLSRTSAARGNASVANGIHQGKASMSDVEARLRDLLTRGQQGEAARKGAVLEDFGEKLGGARKDMAAAKAKEAIEAMERDLSDGAIADLPLSQTWPESFNDTIEDDEIAAVATVLRGEIPAKPRTDRKLAAWAESVQGARDIVKRLISGEVKVPEVLRGMRLTWRYGESVDKVEFLANIDRKYWPLIEKVNAYKSVERTEDGDARETGTYTVLVTIKGEERAHRLEAETVGLAARMAEKSILEGMDTSGKEKPTLQFETRYSSKDGVVFINKKGDKGYHRLKTFPYDKNGGGAALRRAVNEARAFMREQPEVLAAEWEKVKERENVRKDDVRRAENRPRVGKDWRGGKDATPEMFSEAFGFRGVEFGNWVAQGKNAKERQGMLNQAYDALKDLADLLGIDSRALSLNGGLGLAFGSRGHGKFAAHFEPDTFVINLTKTRGAGTLAHEWFHALDNYFSQMRGEAHGKGGKDDDRENMYVTYKPEPGFVHRDLPNGTPRTRAWLEMERKNNPKNSYFAEENWIPDPRHPQGVRPEVERNFAALVEALDASPMAERAKKADKDKNGYWSRIIERSARAFENYIIYKLEQRGQSNDYLANIRPADDFVRDDGAYPYLLESEIAPIEQAFDKLFGEMKQRETDKGVALFARRQLLAQATMQREAYTLEDARSIARREFVGHKLTNAATGQKATLSASNLRKMTSEKAHKKSANARAHAMAVANADALFEAALLDHSHEDKNGEPTIAAIHRFVAPMVFDGRVFAVKMTVKETTSEKNPNPIYSIEAIDVENPPSVLSRAEPDATGIRPRAGFSEKVLERLAEVKRALSDPASRRTDFAREEAAGAPSRGRFALAAGGVRRVVRQALQGVRNAPRVEVVETVADLPFAAPSDAQGAFHNGRVWLVAENLKSAQEAREVLAHEMIGHYGLRGFFGRGLDMVLNRIHRNSLRVQRLSYEWRRDNADLIRTLQARGVSREAIRARSIEEALAQMAQAGEKLTGWKMLAGFVQNLLRKMGAHRWANMLEARTDAEALTALKQAEMFVRDGLTANDTIPNGALAAFERARAVKWADMSAEDVAAIPLQPVRLRLEGWKGTSAELSKLAREVYASELQGTGVDNASMGDDVKFSAEGKGEAFGARDKLKNPVRAEVVRVLRDLVHDAVKVSQEPPKKGREKDSRAFHTLLAPLQVNGEMFAARITVREARLVPKGETPHRFYDIALVQMRQAPFVHGFDDQGSASRPASIRGREVTVSDLARAVNTQVTGGADADAGAAFSFAGERGASDAKAHVREEVQQWLQSAEGAVIDGLVAKKSSNVMLPGASSTQYRQLHRLRVAAPQGAPFEVAQDDDGSLFVCLNTILARPDFVWYPAESAQAQAEAALAKWIDEAPERAERARRHEDYLRRLAEREREQQRAWEEGREERERQAAAKKAAEEANRAAGRLDDGTQGYIHGNDRRPYTPPTETLTEAQVRTVLEGANKVREMQHARSYDKKPLARIRSFSVFKKSKNIPEIAGGFVALAESLGWKASRSVEDIGSYTSSNSGKYLSISRPNPDFDADNIFSDEKITIDVRISDHARTTEMEDFYEENAINLVPSNVFTQSGFAYDTFESALWKLKNARVNERGSLFFGDEEAVYFSRAGREGEPAGNSGGLRGELLALADAARAGRNENSTVVVGEVPTWAADAILEETGAHVAGHQRIADMYAVRHVFKKHGDAAKEKARGQLAVTAEDIAALPDVLNKPDSLILGLKNKRGQDVVFSVKTMEDGTALVAEEVRAGKKTLALASMRKVPGAKNAKDLLPSVLLNARDDAGDARIVYPPGKTEQEGQSSGNHEQQPSNTKGSGAMFARWKREKDAGRTELNYPAWLDAQKQDGSQDDAPLFARGGSAAAAAPSGGVPPSGNNGAPSQQAVNAFGNITAEQEAALRATGLLRSPKTLRQRFAELTDNLGKRLVQGLVDQYAPLKELDFRAYVLARMSKGTDGTFEALLHYGTPKVSGDTLEVDTSTGGLMQVLSELDGEQDRFLAWIAANRAEKLSQEGREFLFTPEQIQHLKALNQGTMKDGTSRAMRYAATLQKFNDFQDAVLAIAEARGLIDAESRAVWQNGFYVPFYRNMEDGTTGASVRSGLVNQYAFKKLKGSRRQLNEDLLANTLQNMAHLLSAAAKNQAASAALRAADSAGVAHRVPSGTKGSVRFLDNGREVHYLVDDPFVFDAITSLESVKVAGLEKVLSKFKHMLTFGVTINPTFQLRSLIRDALQSMAITNIGMNPLANVKQGIASQLKKDQDYINALASGGLIRFNSLLEGNRADYTRRLIRKDVEIEGLAGQLVGDANASNPRTSPSGAILLRGVCKGQSGTTAGRGAGAEGQKEYPATGRGSGNNNPAASDVKAIAHDLLPTNAQSDGGAVGIVLLSNTFRQVTGARRSGARCRFIRRLAGGRP